MQTPKRIAAYVRPWSSSFYQYFIPRAFDGGRPVLLSDWKGLGDFDINSAFYRYFRGPAENVRIPVWLNHSVESEMILRNFLLRNLPLEQASRMIRAMSRAIEDALDQTQPDAMLSPAVDSYVMDLLKRHCVARGIPYCGMLPCPFPGYTRITAVGEYLQFRSPDDSEIDLSVQHVANPSFRPVDLDEWLKMYGASHVHLKRALRELPKPWVFPVLGRIKGDPLNYHYLYSAKTSVSFFSQALFVHRYFTDGWLDKLRQWTGTKVYIPMQAFPECTTDYHVQELDLIDFPRLLARVIDALAQDNSILVCLKEHPGMVGARPPGFYEALLNRPNVLLLDAQVPAASLIAETDVLLTWTGTGGLEAALRGKPVITLGKPYYSHGPMFRTVHNLAELDQIAQTVLEVTHVQSTADQMREVGRHVLSGCFPGEFRFIRFDEQDPGLRKDADALAEGLKRHWSSWANSFLAYHSQFA